MGINVGSNGIGSIYVGSNKIKEIYVGSDKVYSSAPAVRSVTIGNQTWALDYLDVTDGGSGIYTLNGVKYYTQAAATRIASLLPSGWAVPSFTQCQTLCSALNYNYTTGVNTLELTAKGYYNVSQSEWVNTTDDFGTYNYLLSSRTGIPSSSYKTCGINAGSTIWGSSWFDIFPYNSTDPWVNYDAAAPIRLIKT